MIDAGTILQKMKKQTFRYVICFAAEGLYLFENDDIGHLFRGMVPFYVIKKMNQFIFFPAVVFPFFCQNTDKELTMEYCCGTYPCILC